MTDVTLADLFEGCTPKPRGSSARVAVVPGEGIGPAVAASALRVMLAATEVTGTSVGIVHAETDVSDGGFTDEVASEYLSWFESGTPILHGPVGGRFVYEFRSAFDLFVKITPVQPWSELADSTLIRPERIRGTDAIIVRDNVAGLYQGAYGLRDQGHAAFHEATYQWSQIERLMDVAVRLAEQRQGRLTVITKPGGVPTISSLWRQVAEHRTPQNVTLEFLDIDNACFQMVAMPTRFDVLVAPNMFGDVLGDTAATVLGSRGLSYSANFSGEGLAAYQTAHGAAFDLAGRDVANPVAQILTLAWLLQSHWGLADVANLMVGATRQVLGEGIRTADIASSTSHVVGTVEMSEVIAARIEEGGTT